MQPTVQPLIDIAVNLTSASFDKNRDQIIERARAANVQALISLGCDLTSSKRALQLAEQYPDTVYATAGIHPHDASSFDHQSITTLKQLSQHPKIIAVGECGLDFNRDYSPRPQQVAAFEAQLKLAAELQLPVIMHQRDAHDKFIEILSRYRSQLSKAVLHCFTGNKEELLACLELDLHIGITGWICDERRGQTLKEIIKYIPNDRLMLEKDAPFLLPRDLRPKPKSRHDEPANLPHIAKSVAIARSQNEIELINYCYQNSCEFFGINNQTGSKHG